MLKRPKCFLQEDKQFFSDCKSNIFLRNNNMLRKGCIVYAFVLCFYTIFTVITNQPKLLQTMYFVFDAIHICLCIVFFVSNHRKKRSYITTQIYCTGLEVSILSFFALEGVFTTKTQPALYIPIAILLILLLFIHKAIYAYTITALYALSFATLSYLYKTPDAYISDIYISIATFISANIGYAMIAQIRYSEGIALKKYEKLSQTDQLTGLYNKTSIFKICEKILQDEDRACSFIIFDLDNFKKINDLYGHDMGDEIIKSISEEMKCIFKETDFIGRFGGDEFIVLMDNCDDEKAIKYQVEKLLKNIQNLIFSNENIKVHCSAGITFKHKNDTVNTIFKRADNALYLAKSNRKGHFMIIE